MILVKLERPKRSIFRMAVWMDGRIPYWTAALPTLVLVF